MPTAASSRAAVFAREPQDVDIYERGAWWPGKMLGWRHDAGGACQVWVRVEFAGVVEDAWVDLGLLRLPRSRPARHPAATSDPAAAVPTGRHASRAGAHARQAEVDEPRTQHLPLIRDDGSLPAGRPTPSGGRRRAPETAGGDPAQEGPAPAAHTSVGPAESVSGRHRAPVDSGRHRVAGTGVTTAVTSGPSPARVPWDPPPRRTLLPPPGPAVRSGQLRSGEVPPGDLRSGEVRPGGVRPGAEPDAPTGPMRLEDAVAPARRSGRNVLSGA